MNCKLPPSEILFQKVRGKIWTQRHIHTRKTACEEESRDRGNASARQISGWCLGMPKIAGNPPEPRRDARNGLSLTASEGTNPADALISNFWPPELGDNTFLLFKSHSCGTLLGSLSELIHPGICAVNKIPRWQGQARICTCIYRSGQGPAESGLPCSNLQTSSCSLWFLHLFTPVSSCPEMLGLTVSNEC